MTIIVEKLAFSYGDQRVISDISFSVEKGEFMAIMGLSGCGKTTILRLLLGLNKLESGSVSLDGIDYQDENIEQVRDLISYIPQHGALYPHMNVKKNILLPLKVKRNTTEADLEKMHELAKICNISPNLFSRYPSELSGGQRQRVSVLRALMMNTPYIFLDEPLSALDPITKVKIQKEFKSIFKSVNKTIIMVTHSLNEAKYLCDRLLIMKAGSIEQLDNYDQIIKKPKTAFTKEFISAQL